MALTVIDYSEVCFVDPIDEEEVPPQRVGKFVVMWKGEEKFAIFSPTELSRFVTVHPENYRGTEV